MDTATEIGLRNGRNAYDEGLPCQPSRSAFINDAGAAMAYRDAFRQGWNARKAELNGLDGLAIGATVRALIGGKPTDVMITALLVNLHPARFEGDRIVPKGDEEWTFPEEDRRVWGFITDILAVHHL